MKNRFKALITLIIVAIILGCSPEDRRYTNLYVAWKGNDLSTLYVKKGMGEWTTYENGEVMSVDLQLSENQFGEPIYKLTYAGSFEFDYPYFDGYNNYVLNKEGILEKDTTMEMPVNYKTRTSFISTGRYLEGLEEYTISLGRDNY